MWILAFVEQLKLTIIQNLEQHHHPQIAYPDIGQVLDDAHEFSDNADLDDDRLDVFIPN